MNGWALEVRDGGSKVARLGETQSPPRVAGELRFSPCTRSLPEQKGFHPMKYIKSILIAAVAATSASAFGAAPFSPGDILVYRDSTSSFVTPTGGTAPSTTLTANGNEVFIDEYNTTTGLLQGSFDTGMVDPGNSSSHGLMTLSPDGKYLAVPGYASFTSTGVNATTADVNARMVKVYSTSDGSLVGAVSFTDNSITSDFRSAVTDGTNVWIDGSSTTGIRTNTLSSPSATTTNLIGSTSNNYRAMSIVNGQLYLSTNDSAKFDIVGTDVASPITTATGQSLFAQTLTTASAISPFQFAMFNLGGGSSPDTLYMSDDTSATSGIRKFSLVSGAWVENGDFRASPTAAIRGLTGTKNSDGSVTLYATLPPTTASATNLSNVYTYTDTTGFSGSTSGLTGTLTQLASIPTVTNASDSTAATGSYHGIVLLPGSSAPEPASLGMLTVGVAALVMRRRRS